MLALDLARQLIRCPSVTPDPHKTLDIIEHFLHQRGFQVVCKKFGDTTNLFAHQNFSNTEKDESKKCHVMFLGHTDVVPANNGAMWKHPPFDAHTSDNILWGRGAADMKGGIAAFLAALQDYTPSHGCISVLLTSDEEGPAEDGVKKMIPWLQENKADIFPPTFCLIGEPTSKNTVGDTLKIGRRGSLTGLVTIKGENAHIAYPERGPNPLPALFKFWQQLAITLEASKNLGSPNSIFLDNGYRHFDPSHITLTGVSSDTMVMNMTPNTATLSFGIRFNPHHTGDQLKATIEQTLQKYCDLPYDLSLSLHGEADCVEDTQAVALLSQAVQKVTGFYPELSTEGGTSDGRFLAHLCPAIELGLRSHSIHQVDEHVPIEDLTRLQALYASFLTSFFEKDNRSSRTDTVLPKSSSDKLSRDHRGGC